MIFKNDIYICPYCGIGIANKIGCRRCLEILTNLTNTKIGNNKNCDEFTAPFIYKDIVRDAILNFKFKKNKEFCKSFCYFLLGCKINLPDLLVFVPTYKKKFNSSKLITKFLNKELKLKLEKNAIKKIKNTKLQHNCNFAERLQNLKGAFIANKKKVFNKSILICDDVITTGATINEMAFTLKKAGALKVYALAFAISEHIFKK